MEVLAESGLEAIAVEPLATRLGATKGSFYWHFPARPALIEAVLETWEAEHTEAVIDLVEAGESPRERLRRLFTLVLDSTRTESVGRNRGIELALLASRDNPAVAAALDRVTRRRIDYVAEQYRGIGLDPATAHSRAIAAVATYLGHLQLAATSPRALPSGDHWLEHVQQTGAMFTPPTD